MLDCQKVTKQAGLPLALIPACTEAPSPPMESVYGEFTEIKEEGGQLKQAKKLFSGKSVFDVMAQVF